MFRSVLAAAAVASAAAFAPAALPGRVSTRECPLCPLIFKILSLRVYIPKLMLSSSVSQLLTALKRAVLPRTALCTCLSPWSMAHFCLHQKPRADRGIAKRKCKKISGNDLRKC
jgi:hypothetical protein